MRRKHEVALAAIQNESAYAAMGHPNTTLDLRPTHHAAFMR
jgi:hypothetical protein